MNREHSGKILVFSKYITRNGKRIYHPKGKVYRFWVSKDKDNAA